MMTKRLVLRAVAVASLAAVGLGVGAPRAGAAPNLPPGGQVGGTLSVTPSSGPPGTVLIVTPTTPCSFDIPPGSAPPNPGTSVTAEAWLTQGDSVLSYARFPGVNWSGSITIPAQATPGSATLVVHCVPTTQGSDYLVWSYQDTTVDVTAAMAPTTTAAPPPTTLPGASTVHTGEPWSGSGSAVLATVMLGTVLAVLGLGLRRRARVGRG
jgi:hypothetical protein